jgi:hypothetical protein
MNYTGNSGQGAAVPVPKKIEIFLTVSLYVFSILKIFEKNSLFNFSLKNDFFYPKSSKMAIFWSKMRFFAKKKRNSTVFLLTL